MQTDVLLLVDPVGDQILPISNAAFETTPSGPSGVLARNCVALLLDRTGIVWRIEDVTYQGWPPLGALKNALGFAAPAAFSFVEVKDVPLDDFRTMMIDAAMFSRQRGTRFVTDWWLLTAPMEEVTAELEAATTLGELHQRVRFPEPHFCLDLL